MAKRIPESAVDEVLARTDIRGVIEPYVKLQRRGGRLWGLCPFHREKSPSFSVSPEEGLFYCFGCSAGGSSIQFVMRIESWSFPEAIRELATRAGVQLPEEEHDPHQATRRSEKEAYFQILELACRFYEAELRQDRAQVAVEYLQKRGVDGVTAKAFRLGYAPNDWTALLGALRRNKLDEQAVEKAGLALARKSSGYYDRFRDRIMFPVIDRMGRVIGFSGRALGAVEKQKYINSPEIPFFKKGDNLYGIHAAKDALRIEREAIVVEGNFDVVTLHAAGFKTTLAPLGTALTESQVRLLRRVADSAVIVFDGDEAGQRAMRRALAPSYEVGLPVRAAILPENSDPDSFVREHGSEAFTALLKRARPLAEVAVDQTIGTAIGSSVEERVRAAKNAADVLSVLPDGPVRRNYTEDVARRLELRASDVATRSKTAQRPDKTVVTQGLPARERLIIQLVVDEPSLATVLCQQTSFDHLVRAEIQPFIRHISHLSESETAPRLERVVSEFESPLREPILAALSGPREYDPSDKEAMRKTLWQLQVERVKQVKRQLAEKIRTAERADNDARMVELAEQDRLLNRELRELQRQQFRG